jgi:hypothetical protein
MTSTSRAAVSSSPTCSEARCRRKRWVGRLSLFAAALTASAFGCGEECTEGEARCENGVAMTCRSREGVPYWDREVCEEAQSCVLQRATEIVFAPGSNRPESTGRTWTEAVCVSGKSPACASAMERDLRDQYPLADPAADVLEWTAACEGTNLVHCAGEWVTERFTCTSCDLTLKDACR